MNNRTPSHRRGFIPDTGSQFGLRDEFDPTSMLSYGWESEQTDTTRERGELQATQVSLTSCRNRLSFSRKCLVAAVSGRLAVRCDETRRPHRDPRSRRSGVLV
ncbi:hypothetical protein C9J85_15065 [Haloferax sp. wsp5]|nr:hypothetical protein C9J85_15065 [Haloferax sp. wsp5]